MIIFIPIKEHSERVPNKNFRPFNTRPLWKRCLDKFAEHFPIVIDTDSSFLIEELNSGNYPDVTVIRRSKDLIGNNVSVNDLIANAIGTLNISDHQKMCQLHVTSPFLTLETIESAIYKLRETYTSISGANIIKSRLWRFEPFGICPINHNPVTLEPTQMLSDIYEDNSAFYMFEVGAFKEHKNRITKNHLFYPMRPPENLDIDTEEDWENCLSIERSKK